MKPKPITRLGIFWDCLFFVLGAYLFIANIGNALAHPSIGTFVNPVVGALLVITVPLRYLRVLRRPRIQP